jgi:hypothetical protein
LGYRHKLLAHLDSLQHSQCSSPLQYLIAPVTQDSHTSCPSSRT